MSTINMIDFVLLVIGLFLAIVLHILIKQGKLKPDTWPRVFGVGAGVFMFMGSMAASILLRPISEIIDYTLTNFFWSLALGLVGYFGGLEIARRDRGKK